MTAIVGIGGGIGASRLWRVLAAATDPSRLTLVVNTGDDIWHRGLRICPDLDTTLYALSDRQDVERGWGLRDETFRCMEELRALGEEVWFNLGDRDLATHLLRTELLRDGAGLAEVTARLAAAMGVAARVLPATEQEVVTTIETADGRRLHYEEFLVREQVRPPVRAVVYDGADAARPAPGVLDAIAGADLIVLAPSSPPASIAPVLAVPGVRDAICAARAPVVAVSPIVSGVPLEDPGDRGRAEARAALLGCAGVAPTATGVAGVYRHLCDRFVLDTADDAELPAVRELGLDAVAVPTLLHRGAPAQPLLDTLLTVPAEAPWS
ncbi:2-phospho-L-lactate transferase [Capillimicrobium parvum]|uniref:Phosphoenolpyruvate transferase n=1 Tax=Capillimicrobium parvum TaxID=2884022 RepID=A0A9E7BZ36_9ACTN|nr:2-phospho-L-lactate transferase [Capillimicrobium parvum]UGS34905.1 Phosphoenolpyruvate transferase [Capillimicrobium parvum]